MRDFAAPRGRALGPVVSVLAMAVAVAGCSSLAKNEPPPCPPVYILSDASHVTKFRPGAGRDLTDVQVEAEIVGFKGECGYDSKGANVDLSVSLDVRRGPAASSRDATLSYFVAIPKFYPADEAKAVIATPVVFPEGVESVRVTDDGVRMHIPLKNRDLIDQYEIYLGFQTTPEELEMNRRIKR
ncbi:hypothetical protein [Magnetospirillum molischianum]|uniref:Lipoprotein n=1 Tax=Magnetospirillum molischianum DSM 120 TaxID=1150626 RepID=H8FQJ6_MAGML|nr:hypothetical protein [Magnetospirillum molischianum]CCG40634.1 conserved exported hypothetical protein [Magnetospirillum molischianum DSM 120]